MKNIALNLNVRYSSGEAKIDVEREEVAVQTGGIKATAGIKFASRLNSFSRLTRQFWSGALFSLQFEVNAEKVKRR